VIRVLHIDDEAPIRLLARVNLKWEGETEVVEAANGRTGVRLAKREQPDVILLNVNLPGLVGWQVAEELAKDQGTREIPIVFLTARSRLKDRVRGFDSGRLHEAALPCGFARQCQGNDSLVLPRRSELHEGIRELVRVPVPIVAHGGREFRVPQCCRLRRTALGVEVDELQRGSAIDTTR
jgi:CheY-like chemotaxis protein